MTIPGYPDFTKDEGRDGLPLRAGRRNFVEVTQRLREINHAWALIEVAKGDRRAAQDRANSVRASFAKKHPEVQVSQRTNEDGEILLFARIRRPA